MFILPQKTWKAKREKLCVNFLLPVHKNNFKLNINTFFLHSNEEY